MLFSSTAFVFGFLPPALFGAWALMRLSGPRATIGWLVLASLLFYGWWNPVHLVLLGASTVANYLLGRVLQRHPRRWLLAIGIAGNLCVLGYFKYAAFLAATIAAATGLPLGIEAVALPLAISFFTFQKIAYLIDVRNGRATDTGFLDYCLFVTFFPQVIAGPIIHHQDIVPQLHARPAFAFSPGDLGIGAAVFVIGLYKKVVLADGLGAYVEPIFAAGGAPTLFEAWAAALGYTLQIYFDFSGYSEMAIGLARLFGIRLPLNFASPYQAASIIDFWRRWHMTLSRFLRDYLYIPLGGGRHGPWRRHANLMLTMLLGGLWHGAGWTFVFWGGLHGLYLIVNHAWRAVRERHPLPRHPVEAALGRGLTFLAVVCAWVFFRAPSWEKAVAILAGMAGANGVLVPEGLLWALGSWAAWVPVGPLPQVDEMVFLWLTALLPLVWFAPNVTALMRGADVVLGTPPPARSAPLPRGYRPAWLTPFLATAAATAVLVLLVRGDQSARFIYMIF